MLLQRCRDNFKRNGGLKRCLHSAEVKSLLLCLTSSMNSQQPVVCCFICEKALVYCIFGSSFLITDML